jgi:hypothetical protein
MVLALSKSLWAGRRIDPTEANDVSAPQQSTLAKHSTTIMQSL